MSRPSGSEGDALCSRSRWRWRWRAWTKRGTSSAGCTSTASTCQWRWWKTRCPKCTSQPSAAPTTRRWCQQRRAADRGKRRYVSTLAPALFPHIYRTATDFWISVRQRGVYFRQQERREHPLSALDDDDDIKASKKH